MILVTIIGQERRVMQWHYAAIAKAVIFLTFDIDVLVLKYLDTVQLCWKYCFMDLNSLGACIAEKQQSDEKLSKSENKQNLIMRW